MDVLCPQCSYAYELDDALLTSTGTLVRCTKCDCKFRAARAAEDAPWIVQTFDGGSARFRNLADVQQAIVRGELGRGDLLARGRGPARPLGSIVELEGFFNEHARLGGEEQPFAFGSVPDDIPTSPTLPTEERSVRDFEFTPDGAAFGSDSGAGYPTRRTEPPSFAPASHRPTTAPSTQPVLPEPASVLVVPASARGAVRPSPEVPALAATYPSEPPRSAAPIVLRPPARSTGWVVAASLLVAVGSGAFLLGRRYTKASPPSGEPRSPQTFDFDAIAADVRAGRLERARDAVDELGKSLGAEPRVVALRAHVAVAVADVAASVASVAQKLGTQDSPSLALAAEEAAADAMKAAERAAELSPESNETVVVLAQACALSGARTRARQFVERLDAVDHAHAYADALVASVEGRDDRLTRLEGAFGAEPFRARLRVLAERVGSPDQTMQTALIASLRGATDSASVLRWLEVLSTPAVAPTGSILPAVDAGPRRAVEPADEFGVAFEGAEAEPAGQKIGAKRAPSDPRKAVEEGDRARRRGDLAAARSAFQVALDANPLDSEALAGLGDCARDARELAVASGFYRRALSANPNYLPARLALADVQWATGERGASVKAYREIIDNFPEGAYPPVVRERAFGSATPPAEAP